MFCCKFPEAYITAKITKIGSNIKTVIAKKTKKGVGLVFFWNTVYLAYI